MEHLIFTIVVNLFILGFFKYYGFIVTNLNAILPFYIPYRKLELPIGISFYTFQTLSYIIDVYRGNVDVQVNLIDFGTYVTMFPQLIAGPIVQYADVERQLRERKESLTKFGYGAWFFVMGLAKKVLLRLFPHGGAGGIWRDGANILHASGQENRGLHHREVWLI